VPAGFIVDESLTRSALDRDIVGDRKALLHLEAVAGQTDGPLDVTGCGIAVETEHGDIAAPNGGGDNGREK